MDFRNVTMTLSCQYTRDIILGLFVCLRRLCRRNMTKEERKWQELISAYVLILICLYVCLFCRFIRSDWKMIKTKYWDYCSFSAFIYLFAYRYLYIYLSLYLYIYLPTHTSIYLSTYPSIYLSMRAGACVFVHVHGCIYIRVYVCTKLHLSQTQSLLSYVKERKNDKKLFFGIYRVIFFSFCLRIFSCFVAYIEES